MRILPSLLAAIAFLAPVERAGASARHRVIALVPVGAVDALALARLAPAVREAFDAEVVILDPLALPSRAFDAQRKQHVAAAILDELAPLRRPEWERVLGVCDVDLFAPGLNFVFGEADPTRKVAVFSLARLRAEQSLFGRRAATEAVHELGHTYGLRHCDDPHCVMWFSNRLSETDRKGTTFCPTHAAALGRTR